MIRPARQKWLLVLVGILLVTNIITLAVSWSTKRHKSSKKDSPKPRMGQFMVDQMKFDSVQEVAYWTLRDTLVSRQKPVWDSLRMSKKRFFDLLSRPDVNDSVLQEKANEIAANQKKLDLITFRHFQQVKALCKPEQMQKMDTVIKEIVNRMTSFKRSNNNKPGNGDKKDSSGKK